MAMPIGTCSCPPVVPINVEARASNHVFFQQVKRQSASPHSAAALGQLAVVSSQLTN